MGEGKIVRRGVQPPTPIAYIEATVEASPVTVPYQITPSESVSRTTGVPEADNSGWYNTGLLPVGSNNITFNNYDLIMYMIVYDINKNYLGYYENSTSYSAFGGLAGDLGNLNSNNITVHPDTAFILLQGYQGTSYKTVTTSAFSALTIAHDGSVQTGAYEDNGTFYKYHAFKSSGTFTVNSLADDLAKNEIDYLVIAGGGGGGKGGGGGGAGGYRTTLGISGGNSSAESKVTVTTQAYTITVGAGGNSSNGLTVPPTSGANSSAFGITSIGGGAGGNYYVNFNGINGGSGGGGGSYFSSGSAGLGTSGQGFNGGAGSTDNSTYRTGGGGGGASQAGTNGTGNLGGGIGNGGNGGNGLSSSITGTSVTRAGGGGGFPHLTGVPGQGGLGGGGDAVNGPATPDNFGNPGLINTGSGGGAGDRVATGNHANNGGSGVVIIRYEIGGL